MAQNIWQKLKKPFLALAPMEDVTDTVFRQIVASCGAPDVYFTEFASADGLQSAGRNEVGKRLKFTDLERPLIAQIWGMNPEAYLRTASELAEMGFDGIDINMGCPVDKVIKHGACSALIKNPSLAAEIIAATREGAGELAVSVKTRIGFNEVATEEWCGFLLEQKLDALIVHGRTTKEQSKVPANWDEIAKVVSYRGSSSPVSPSPGTVIIGNGDVESYADAMDKVAKYGVDGVMIGRGIFHNPWIFNENVSIEDKTVADRIELLLRHLRLFNETWGEEKDFNIMKKFVKMYVGGFEGAAELRDEMMRTKSHEELLGIIESVKL